MKRSGFETKHMMEHLKHIWKRNMTVVWSLEIWCIVRSTWLRQIQSAADLGMFSMFDRTGAPQKGAPQKRPPQKNGKFLHARKMGDPRVKREWWAKVASFWRELTADTRTVMTKKDRQFFCRKNRVCRRSWRAPHFFLNRALLRVNPALNTIQIYANLHTFTPQNNSVIDGRMVKFGMLVTMGPRRPHTTYWRKGVAEWWTSFVCMMC